MCTSFLTYSHISWYLIFIYLANFRNKLLSCGPILWWGEMNLIGRFFLVSLPGRSLDFQYQCTFLRFPGCEQLLGYRHSCQYARVSPSSITRLEYIFINCPKRIEMAGERKSLSIFIVSLLDKNVRR